MKCMESWWRYLAARVMTENFRGDMVRTGKNIRLCLCRRSAHFRTRLKMYRSMSSRNQSVQFSRSVVSDSLRPHESQHARPPCPSPTPGVYSISCPSSPRCHPAISSSVVPFSSCPQSLPASESFPMSQLFT